MSTIIRVPNAGRITIGDSPKASDQYYITGVSSELTAAAALEGSSLVPPSIPDGTTFDGLRLKTIDVEKTTVDGQYVGTVTYAPPEETENEEEDEEEEGGVRYSFDTSGGTQHITQSRRTQSYGTGGAQGSGPPNFRGAIGVNGDDVDGVDIIMPSLRWSVSTTRASSRVNSAWVRTIARMTGKVNNSTFEGFSAGELLFMGCSGSQKGAGEYELRFDFEQQNNETSITVGDISGISKGGYQYLWTWYEPKADTDAGAILQTPAAVYVETVYESASFSSLL